MKNSTSRIFINMYLFYSDQITKILACVFNIYFYIFNFFFFYYLIKLIIIFTNTLCIILEPHKIIYYLFLLALFIYILESNFPVLENGSFNFQYNTSLLFKSIPRCFNI